MWQNSYKNIIKQCSPNKLHVLVAPHHKKNVMVLSSKPVEDSGECQEKHKVVTTEDLVYLLPINT